MNFYVQNVFLSQEKELIVGVKKIIKKLCIAILANR